MDPFSHLESSETGHMDISGEQQITFEIPSSLDFERISSFNNFTALLSNGGSFGFGGGGGGGGSLVSGTDLHLSYANIGNGGLSGNNENIQSAFGKLSTGDYHMILNYLWIGVVTLLIIMSMIFVLFSCYFYRKFKEWKKCNKDIRSQIQNDLCPAGATEADYYQMESPPCYTIATGLPTYDEALVHSNFIFGMKIPQPWICPSQSNYTWEGSTTLTMVTANPVKDIESCISINEPPHGHDPIDKDFSTKEDDCTEVVVTS